MKRISTQSGLTLMSFKLFPVYNQYFSVVTAMKGLASEPGVKQLSPQQVRDRLFKRFNISYVDSVKPENIKVTRENGYQLTVAYEVRRNLMYNLDFVAVFDKTVELGAKDID